MNKVFTDIYENCIWGSSDSAEYNGSSGPGSEVSYNRTVYVPFLKHFISTLNIKTIVDMGCGDFKCGPLIYRDLDVAYTGYDAYEKVITYNKSKNPLPKFNFVHLDFFHCWDDIVNGDLCILKDVLQHWNLGDIYNFMDFVVFGNKFKYVLVCNCGYQTHDNTDIETGDFRPLRCKFLPLRRYHPKVVLTYHSKEVSLIEVPQG